MKQIIIFLIMIGLAAITACSSNEANMKPNMKADDMASDMKTEPVVSAAKADDMQEASAGDTSVKTEMDAESDRYKNRISVCKHGKQIRIISVIYKQGASSTSCKVTYEKSSGVKTLWSAESDTTYCINRAYDFVAKQESWGWSCSNLE